MANGKTGRYDRDHLGAIRRIRLCISLAVLLHLSNPHKEEAWSPTMAFGLYTEGGALLYCDGRTLENVGIPSGGGMTVRFDVSRSFAERWAEYGADPAEVRATADCGGDD